MTIKTLGTAFDRDFRNTANDNFTDHENRINKNEADIIEHGVELEKHDKAINAMGNESNLGQRVTQLEQTSQDGEVLAARQGYASLADRLNALDPGVGIKRKTFTATAGQTLFSIAGVGSYARNENRLTVIVGGVPQISGEHFTETSSTSFTMSEGVPAGVKVYAQWFEGNISLISGHGNGHKKGGFDEINLQDLAGYQEGVLDNIELVANSVGLSMDSFPRLTGETDDAPAIRRALAELKSLGKGDLVFTKDYVVSTNQEIVIDSPNIRLKGIKGARIIIRDGAGSRSFVVRETSDIEVDGLVFKSEATSSTTPYNALDIQNSNRVKVRKCEFYNFTFYGVSITENTATDPFTNGSCNDITVELCHFENIGTHGLIQFPKVLSYNCKILKNTFKNCGLNPLSGADGVALKAGQATIGTLIDGNIFEGCYTAIGVMNWETVEVVNNIVRNCHAHGLSLNVESHVKYPNATYQSLVARGNEFIFLDGFTPSTLNAAFAVYGTVTVNKEILFESNKIRKWTSGFAVRGNVSIPNIRIKKNNFLNVGGSTIDNTNGAFANAPEVMENLFQNDDLTLNLNIKIAGNNAKFVGNTIIRYGDYAVWANPDTGTIEVSKNVFFEPVVLKTSNRGAIFCQAAGTYIIEDNEVDNGVNGGASYIINSTAATKIIEKNNRGKQSTIKVAISATNPIVFEGFITRGGRRIFQGTAMPTSGYYEQGDYVEVPKTTIQGTTGSKYVLKGWNRVTTGSAHVLNTDWVEDKVLTGT